MGPEVQKKNLGDGSKGLSEKKKGKQKVNCFFGFFPNIREKKIGPCRGVWAQGGKGKKLSNRDSRQER